MAGDSRQAELAQLLDENANLPGFSTQQFKAKFASEIFEHAAILTRQIVQKTVGKYPWISGDDLQQELLMRIDFFADRFDPTKGNSWVKNMYFRLNFYVKDVLRKEDPVGIKWPQREHYPQWFRLGCHDGRQEGEDLSHFGADFDGSSLVDDDGPSLEAIEQRQWQADFDAVGRLAEEIRGDNRIPSMVDCGHGVCRSTELEFWSKRKGRLKFRGKSLLSWLRRKRKTTRKRITKLRNSVIPIETPPIADQTCPTLPALQIEVPLQTQFIPQHNLPITTNRKGQSMNAVERIRSALARIGSAGETRRGLEPITKLASATAKAAISTMRASGEVYVVSHREAAASNGKKQEVYALASFFPDGPPIEQPQNQLPKAKAKGKPSSGRATSQDLSKPGKIDPADIMLVVTALAGVRHAGLKARLLAVLEESVKG